MGWRCSSVQWPRVQSPVLGKKIPIGPKPLFLECTPTLFLIQAYSPSWLHFQHYFLREIFPDPKCSKTLSLNRDPYLQNTFFNLLWFIHWCLPTLLPPNLQTPWDQKWCFFFFFYFYVTLPCSQLINCWMGRWISASISEEQVLHFTTLLLLSPLVAESFLKLQILLKRQLNMSELVLEVCSWFAHSFYVIKISFCLPSVSL